jgi:flagellar protein FliS
VGKRYEQKAISLDKCTQIINGLSSSLDFDNGGEVVVNLARLYDYCVARLYRAGIDMDPAIIDEVVGLLTTIRQGWLGVQAKHG